MKNYDVFISYSHKDKIIADAICHRFEEDELKCWMAPRDIAPGENWAESIVSVIPACKIFFLIFSSSSNMSKQVLREVELAVSNGLTILPVRIEDIRPSGGMAYYLSTVHWIDAIDKEIETKLHSLSKSVTNTLKFGTQPIAENRNLSEISLPGDYKKRRNLTVLWIAVAVVFVIGGFIYLNNKIGKQTDTATILESEKNEIVQQDETKEEILETGTAQQNEIYDVLLDIDFDDKEDGNWFEIHGDNTENIVSEDCIEEGVFTLKGEIAFKRFLAMGEFIHIKLKSPDFDKNGTMFLLDFSNEDFDFSTDRHSFRFYFTNNQTPSLDLSKGDSYAHVEKSYSSMMIKNNMLLDVFIWLNEDDDSIRYIVSDADNINNIGCMGIELSDEWIGDNWSCSLSLDTGYWDGKVTAEELYTDIEFVKVATGSLTAYMDEYIEAYEQNKDTINDFISKPMTLISDLHYIGGKDTENEKYNILLDLEFDKEEDYQWIFSNNSLGDNCEYKDERIYIYSGGINLDYIPNPGTFIHYKAVLPQDSTIDLSGYRVNSNITFESVYNDGRKDYFASGISLEGLPFKNNGQYIDVIIYIDSDKTAVYAIAIDNQNGKIAYYSCQIPEEKRDVALYSSFENFGAVGPIIVESITIANGSLKEYLSENFEVYNQNQEMVNEFLDRDIETLPEITHK